MQKEFSIANCQVLKHNNLLLDQIYIQLEILIEILSCTY